MIIKSCILSIYLGTEFTITTSIVIFTTWRDFFTTSITFLTTSPPFFTTKIPLTNKNTRIATASGPIIDLLRYFLTKNALNGAVRSIMHPFLLGFLLEYSLLYQHFNVNQLKRDAIFLQNVLLY